MKEIKIEHTKFDKKKLFPITNFIFKTFNDNPVLPLTFFMDLILWNILIGLIIYFLICLI